MKELVARATLKTSQYLNEGYIHICEKLCEGVFTLDYLSLAIIDKKLIVHVSENTVNSNFMLVKKEKLYSAPYSYDSLFIPDNYTLHDDQGNVLTLNISDVVSNQEDISKILDGIELAKK